MRKVAKSRCALGPVERVGEFGSQIVGEIGMSGARVSGEAGDRIQRSEIGT